MFGFGPLLNVGKEGQSCCLSKSSLFIFYPSLDSSTCTGASVVKPFPRHWHASLGLFPWQESCCAAPRWPLQISGMDWLRIIGTHLGLDLFVERFVTAASATLTCARAGSSWCGNWYDSGDRFPSGGGASRGADERTQINSMAIRLATSRTCGPRLDMDHTGCRAATTRESGGSDSPPQFDGSDDIWTCRGACETVCG